MFLCTETELLLEIGRFYGKDFGYYVVNSTSAINTQQYDQEIFPYAFLFG